MDDPQLTYVPKTGRRAVRVPVPISVDGLRRSAKLLQEAIRHDLIAQTAVVPLLRLSDLGTAAEREAAEFTETTAGRTVVPDRSAPVIAQLLRTRPEFVTATGEPTLRTPAADAYMRRSADLVGKLLTLIHLTSGQPARGSELAGLTFRNSTQGERSLYFSEGTVLLLQRYTKNRKLAGRDAYVPRYLDAVTADLLVSYLAQCRPGGACHFSLASWPRQSAGRVDGSFFAANLAVRAASATCYLATYDVVLRLFGST